MINISEITSAPILKRFGVISSLLRLCQLVWYLDQFLVTTFQKFVHVRSQHMRDNCVPFLNQRDVI